MTDLEFCWAAIKRGNLWKIKVNGKTSYGFPVDGERKFKVPGLSCGIIHIEHHSRTDEIPQCWVGISYFREHAKELVEK